MAAGEGVVEVVEAVEDGDRLEELPLVLAISLLIKLVQHLGAIGHAYGLGLYGTTFCDGQWTRIGTV